jgi:hypothetical protein
VTGRRVQAITLSILFLTLVGFILRVYRLDFFSLRGDEAFTVLFVQRTWEGLWRGISLIEPNPPLMYLLLRVWVALVGTSEFATRYFSLIFGVLCIPLLYRLALIITRPVETNASTSEAGDGHLIYTSRDGTWQWVALFAAALITINPYQIWHSQDVRNYTLWPALSLASLIFFCKWWNGEREQLGRESQISMLVCYTFFALASLYTHYYDVFILAAENLFVFAFALYARRWRTLGRWVGAQAVLVLAFAPWVLFGTNRITTYGEASGEKGISLLDQFGRTIASVVISDTVNENLHSVIWVPLALGLLAILVYLARKERQWAAFLFLYIAVPTILLYIISLGRPLFNERYLNGVAPAYYIAFAFGLAALWPPHTSWQIPAFYVASSFFALVSAYALANYWYDPGFAKAPDWRGLVQEINPNLRSGDIIIQNFNEVSVQYYRRGNTPVITLPRDYWFRPEDEKTLSQVNKDYRRIWFIPAQPDWWDPDQDIERLLSRYDDRESVTQYSVFSLQLYSTPLEFASQMTPLNARLGAATLSGYRLDRNKDRVRVLLYWHPAQKIEASYQVFVHLADATGQVVAQSESVPAEGTYPTTTWQANELIVDTHDIKTDAIGSFTIFVGMHDPAANIRAFAFDATGTRLPDDQIPLTQITLP